MPFPDRITAFSEQFAQTHQAQWTAFSKRIVSADAPRPFIAVVSSIAAFLDPVVTAYAKKESFESRWTAPGPWESR